MMPRPFRRTPIALLVAFHATVMLWGPCLHALPGWGHEAFAKRATGDGQHGDPGKTPHGSGHDCPVCHFLLQGQLPIESAREPVLRLAGSLASLDRPEIASRSCHRISCPRAPPAACTAAA
jgi:hypothetical protein